MIVYVAKNFAVVFALSEKNMAKRLVLTYKD